MTPVFRPILLSRKNNIFRFIQKFNPVLARHFLYLDRRESEIALKGINRHIQACRRLHVDFDLEAIEEIIEDAKQCRAVFSEKDFLTKKVSSNFLAIYQKAYQSKWKRLPQNRSKLKGYYNKYRRKNLDSIRTKQRNAYRIKNNVQPQDYQSKLNETSVIELRDFYAAGLSIGELAEKYGVSDRTIYDAAVGRTWKHLPVPTYQNRKHPNRGRHIPSRKNKSSAETTKSLQ